MTQEHNIPHQSEHSEIVDTLTEENLRANKYISPIEDPLEYPGRRPPWNWVLYGDHVVPITHVEVKDGRLAGITLYTDHLSEDDKAVLGNFSKEFASGEYVPVVGFGSNACPGQLVSKDLGQDIIPVIQAEMTGVFAAWNSFSKRGYPFAELAAGKPDSKLTVYITFLKDKAGQGNSPLHRMDETEPNYDRIEVPGGVTIPGSGEIAADVYAGKSNLFYSPTDNSPIAMSEVPSSDESLKSMDIREFINLLIKKLRLEDVLQTDLSPELLTYLVKADPDVHQTVVEASQKFKRPNDLKTYLEEMQHLRELDDLVDGQNRHKDLGRKIVERLAGTYNQNHELIKIGQEIRRVRIVSGITIEKLAQVVGVRVKTLKSLELGQLPITEGTRALLRRLKDWMTSI